jgi:hypothetical protein
VTAPTTQVWRLAVFGRVLATVIAAGPAVMAVAVWVMAAERRSAEGALMAVTVTGVAAGFGLFLWWVALRPKVVLTADEVVAVNPWGTQRVPVTDVVAVTRSLFGARLELSSGWAVTAFALAEAYGGLPARGRRVAQLAEAVMARQRALGVR